MKLETNRKVNDVTNAKLDCKGKNYSICLFLEKPKLFISVIRGNCLLQNHLRMLLVKTAKLTK